MITGNEPAMPFQSSELSGMNEAHHGLTIRQHFAVIAMQGMLACSHREGSSYDYAVDAVNFSDALIAELNKEK